MPLAIDLRVAPLWEMAVRYIAWLVVLLVAVGWSAAEMPLADPPSPRSADPEWRRTTEGWMKVGPAGAAALTRPQPELRAEPAVHPSLVAAFLLSLAVSALLLFDRPNSAE